MAKWVLRKCLSDWFWNCFLDHSHECQGSISLCPKWIKRKFVLLLMQMSFVSCAIVWIDLTIWSKFCGANDKNLIIMVFNCTIAFRTSNKNVWMIWCWIKHFVIEAIKVQKNKGLCVKGFEWASWCVRGVGRDDTKLFDSKMVELGCVNCRWRGCPYICLIQFGPIQHIYCRQPK